MDILFSAEKDWFSKNLENLKCEEETRAYIVSIFTKYLKTAQEDYSKESLTLLYSEARDKHNFIIYQNLGDWIFFCKTFFPEFLKNASDSYYQCIAKNCYYSCFKLINKKWKVFEELSDNFEYLNNKTIIELNKYKIHS